MTYLPRLTAVEEVMDTDQAVVIIPHDPPMFSLTEDVWGGETVFVNWSLFQMSAQAESTAAAKGQCEGRNGPSN